MGGGLTMTEKEKEKDISSIDRLFLNIERYRNSKEFYKMLQFYKEFPYLGLYNAAFVQQQRPGAKLVLTADRWREEYHRQVKFDACPVVILMPFYPVDFLFDISDTEAMDGYETTSDNIIIEDIISQFQAEANHHFRYEFDNIVTNMARNGIKYHNNYVVGSQNEAKISPYRMKMDVPINRKDRLTHQSSFVVSVNSRSDIASSIASIAHELGHLLCMHITAPGWWKARELSKEVMEFEAEVVSYLICERFGIKTSSVEYLAGYVENNERIPNKNIELVIKAVDYIEHMLKENIEIKKGLMYRYDTEFKILLDKWFDEKHKRENANAAQKLNPGY